MIMNIKQPCIAHDYLTAEGDLTDRGIIIYQDGKMSLQQSTSIKLIKNDAVVCKHNHLYCNLLTNYQINFKNRVCQDV